jgi:hypothetical protein
MELEIKVFLYGHLVPFTAIWYISLPFGTFCGNLVYFAGFGMLCQEKSGNHGYTCFSILPRKRVLSQLGCNAFKVADEAKNGNK